MLTTRNVSKKVFGAGLPDRVEMLLELHRAWPQMAVLAANAARILDQAHALAGEMQAPGVDAIVGFDTLERRFDPGYYEDMDRELPLYWARFRVIAQNRRRDRAERVAGWVRAITGPCEGRSLVREIEPVAA